MIYIFDSGPLINLFRYYYPERFPSLWENFNELVLEQRIISVRVVKNELVRYGDNLSVWVKKNSECFHTPTNAELHFVAEIFRVPHFQALIRKKEQLQGKPVADPFVIAKAKSYMNGCVVTEEKYAKGAARIPNVCEHFQYLV